MGICGTGKSTVARALADRIGGTFVEADEFHDPAAVGRMRAGQPLDDALRWGWLDRVGAAMAGAPRPVVACSALKRAYRDRLRARAGPLDVLFLHGDPALIAARMAARPGHFMPPSLIASQLATLEPPGADEQALTCAITLPLEAIVARALAAFA